MTNSELYSFGLVKYTFPAKIEQQNSLNPVQKLAKNLKVEPFTAFSVLYHIRLTSF